MYVLIITWLFPYSIVDAQEFFPDMDLEILKELYVQARKNKQVLFEMCY